jgi:hypothetical protein
MHPVTAEALAAAAEQHTGLDTLQGDATTRWCAAIGAAHVLWRDGPLEDIHAGPGKLGGLADAYNWVGVSERLIQEGWSPASHPRRGNAANEAPAM